jgi:hypothetical protein
LVVLTGATVSSSGSLVFVAFPFAVVFLTAPFFVVLTGATPAHKTLLCQLIT